MLTLFFWLLNLGTVVVVYWFWARPILRKTPQLSAIYAREESYIAAFSVKFTGIKQRMTAAFVYIVGLFVTMHDFVAPHITGVDVTPFTAKIAGYVPSFCWPLIAIGFAALMDYFRVLSDKRNAGG